MDKSCSYPAFSQMNSAPTQINILKQTLNSNRDKQIGIKKPIHKMCSFKWKIMKIGEKPQIQVIQTHGQFHRMDNYQRCKYTSIAIKCDRQAHSNLFQEYIKQFYEKQFCQLFLSHKKSLAVQPPTTSSQSSSSSQKQCYSINEIKTSQNKISMQTIKILPGNKTQRQQLKCPKINEESLEQPKQLNNNDEAIINHKYQTAREIKFDKSYEFAIESMFLHLDQQKNYFEKLFIFQEMAKSSDISMSNPDYFESCLPSIILKEGEDQRFAELINKIVKEFLQRGNKVKRKNIISNQNYLICKLKATKADQNMKKSKKMMMSKSIKTDSEEDQGQYIGSEDEEEEDDDDYYYGEEEEEEEEEEDLYANIEVVKSESLFNQQNINIKLIQKNEEKEEKNNNNIQEQNQVLSINEIKTNITTLTNQVVSNKNSKIQDKIYRNSVRGQEMTSQPALALTKTVQLLFTENRKRKMSAATSSSSSQSKYHNLKNSFMHLIISLFNSEVLNCFSIPSIYLDYTIQIIERMKNYSFKYRPVKGRYQYYSNIHYSTLFLKLHTLTLKEVKDCQQNLLHHEIFFKENLKPCSNTSDFPVLKCNFYKLLIAKIVSFALDEAQVILEDLDSGLSRKYLEGHRYLYINKVKKGIQKLQKGIHVIRF